MKAYDWSTKLKPLPLAKRNTEAVAPGSEVIVYGSGSVAAELIRVLRARGVRIRRVLDGNTTRKEVEGVAIHPPDDPAISRAERPRLPLLIGIFNRDVDFAALEKKLDDGGWTWRIDFLEIHALLPGLIADRFWLTSRDVYPAQAEEIARVDALWADEASRELYQQILNFRLTGNRRGLPAPDPSSQYFPPDIPAWKTPLRLIDCGAYDGDTVRDLLKTGLPIEAIAALEPDPKNYALLEETLRVAERSHSLAATAWPCGAWRKTTELRFKKEGGEGSAIDQEGDTVIQVRALDDFLADFRPTLIKMDIEGAEFEALLGARELIRRSRCGLAVCVYHHAADLWRIPLLLAEWNFGYEFYLRAHAHSGFELVLYALAK